MRYQQSPLTMSCLGALVTALFAGSEERARAQEQLMTQVSALAVAGAEKVLGAEIDADKHADLLKTLSAGP